MRNILTRAALGVAAMLLFAAGTASASPSDILEVKVPFPFMVRGQIFPAGHYMVERDDMAGSVLLIRGERGNRSSAAFVETTPAGGHDPAGNRPALSFTRGENQYRLSGVWESRNEGQLLLN